jgi:hypothetical protein
MLRWSDDTWSQGGDTAHDAGGAHERPLAGEPSGEAADPRPSDSGGFHSAYLPAAPAAPTGTTGTTGSYPTDSYPTGSHQPGTYRPGASYQPDDTPFPADSSGWGDPSYPGATGTGSGSLEFPSVGDSTETFGAVPPAYRSGGFRLSLPTESTETFPAVPRDDSSGRNEDG